MLSNEKPDREEETALPSGSVMVLRR